MRKPFVSRQPPAFMQFVLCLLVSIASFAHGAPARFALDGHMPPALSRAEPSSGAPDPDESMMLTIVLRRHDQAGFDAFVREVADPQSPAYRRYLTPVEQANRFGPSPGAYDLARDWLSGLGFRLVAGSANRLTLTVEGTRAQVESAFDVRVGDYRLGERSFHAADRAPSLPPDIAPHVEAVIGLSNLARPVRVKSQDVVEEVEEARKHHEEIGPDNLPYSCWLAGLMDLGDSASLMDDMTTQALKGGYEFGLSSISPAVTLLRFMCAADEINMLNRLALGLDPNLQSVSQPPYAAPAAKQGTAAKVAAVTASTPWSTAGNGQKIGLLEFDNFLISDVQDFLNLIGRSAQIAQLSQVHVGAGAGAPGPDQSEVLLDVDAAMSLAPGAQVVVYDGPFAGRGTFQTMLNAMIGDGVTIISNSWAYCEDQTTLADVQSLETILTSAAAAGITVITGSGDSGSTCLDGSPNVIAVPAGAPHITTVGGASSLRSVAGTYGSESWWDGSAGLVRGGQGGFGVSRFFARPSYQDGLTASPMRSIPDLTAPADPRYGYFVCQASAGGCPTNLLYGGTSVAAPIIAAMVAVLNQQTGAQQGFLNPKLYPLHDTPNFHSATELNSDFAHVGLGTPNSGLLYLALTNSAAGAVDISKSAVGTFPPVVTANGVAQGGVVIALRDAAFNSVSGVQVQLFTNGGSSAIVTPLETVTNVSNGIARFLVTDTVAEVVTFTAYIKNGPQLAQHPSIQFITPPATAGGITASPTTVTADGTASTTITVTMQTNGQPAPGKFIAINEGSGSAVIKQVNALTDSTGKARFTATNFKTETVTFSAIDTTDGNLPIPGTVDVAYVSGTTVPCNTGAIAADPAYAVTTFVSNVPFDNYTCVGPIGVAFSPNNDFYVMSNSSGDIYRFGQAGGSAGPATLWSTALHGSAPAALLFTPDGRLFAARKYSSAVVELDADTGAILRTVTTAIGSPLDMKVDPVSGDLFVSNFDGIQRIANWQSGTATVSPFYPPTGSSLFTDGFTVGTDGTVYVKTGCCPAVIAKVNGTNTATPGASTVAATIPAGDGIGIQQNAQDPSKPVLYLNRTDGIITRVDLATNPATTLNVTTNGSRGDFVTVGPDGCLYATQSDRVVKLSNADSTCNLLPTNTFPTLTLTPAVANPFPVQGSTTTFTATLAQLPNPAGTPITLLITGANPSLRTAKADANGVATFTYQGVRSGTDQVMAFLPTAGAPVSSNLARADWTPGSHKTFLNLVSPIAGRPYGQVTISAKLLDIGADPAVVAPGMQVQFSAGGANCSAMTDAGGIATCILPLPFPPGAYTATAAFAGSGQFLASSATAGLQLMPWPALDIDNNGAFDPATDGLLIVRYLFGFRGSALTADALGANAQRTNPDEIAAYIAGLGVAFDVDGNQQVDALTDGLMLMRYLAGLRGAALTESAIGAGATRAASGDIQTFIQFLLP